MFYWVNFNNPKCFQAAKNFIYREWIKHGLPAGLSVAVFIYLGLVLRINIHDSCEIIVGQPISLRDAFEQAENHLSQLKLFQEYVGAAEKLQIKAMYDVRFSKFTKKSQPFLIHEVRVHFSKEKVDGAAGGIIGSYYCTSSYYWKLIAPPAAPSTFSLEKWTRTS
ncbi:hypothetical protein OROMI_019287 [Orobanche minor]